MHKSNVFYRTTGVILQDLNINKSLQGDLFGGSLMASKLELIHNQIDKLEDKFGKRLVYLASTHNAIKNKAKGTDSDELERNLLFL